MIAAASPDRTMPPAHDRSPPAATRRPSASHAFTRHKPANDDRSTGQHLG